MSSTLRPAALQDAGAILGIYVPYIDGSAISFEYELPSVSEIERRITDTLRQFPWLVYEREGNVLGYAYAGPHSSRAAYQWSADVSVYIDASVHRRGVGRGLYTALFSLLKQQGYHRLYAGITLPNESSVRLHEAMGLQPVGVYHKVGYKLATWHDVGWWEFSLQDHEAVPDPPISFAILRQDEAALQKACAAGLAVIRD